MAELPDIVLGFCGEHWTSLGLNPVFLYRLLEMGWTHDDVDQVFSKVIGPDYAEVNATAWIDRLEARGIECSDSLDRPPFKIVLDRIIFVYLTTGKIMMGDYYINVHKDDDCLSELAGCNLIHPDVVM